MPKVFMNNRKDKLGKFNNVSIKTKRADFKK